MTPAVQAAVDEVKQLYLDQRIEVVPEDQGGAYIIMHDLVIGNRYVPAVTWIGFLITFQYPYADIYPFYVHPELKRSDGTALPGGFSGPTTWNGRQALQVSRKSNRWKAGVDTAATKLTQVLDWIKSV